MDLYMSAIIHFFQQRLSDIENIKKYSKIPLICEKKTLSQEEEILQSSDDEEGTPYELPS